MKGNMTIKIEKGVPIPEARTKQKWPWKQLKVGDSFVAPIEARSMYPTAIRAGERLERKFMVRKEGTGCRVWRTE